MKRVLSLSILFVFLLSCQSKDEVTTEDVVKNYSTIAYSNYTDAHSHAVALKNDISNFIDNPSQTGLSKAKQAWLLARESYGQTEAFRFYGGPIDGEDGPEGQLNAWPLDEAYIDYVSSEGSNNANIINSPEQFPEITAEFIASMNERGSEVNVSAGYHAIEFLLWGQDLSEGPGAGQRKYTDYVEGEKATAKNADRRKKYLLETVNLLLEDLKSVMQEWEPNKQNYRAKFTSNPDQSIEKIVSGLGKLSKGELAGERMFVAYDLQSKEDEHSCFSDNTHRDIAANAKGIQNVFLGNYESFTTDERINGPSIYDLLKQKDKTLAEEIKETISTGVVESKAIEAPFDQQIKNEAGRKQIAKTISLFRKQGDLLAAAANKFGFKFDPTAI
ncbi:putative iron-regulated protein [Marivirga sericea]|uniref:Putative iron-regulated protein n=1 Tax=Marivirga sericea TaxID=1028 RepID=A0A1X7KS80_9BACT|nr:imelysin family protein [Marivirga sericea]SMG44190.1 putative iron-regulated protein [Marivirga sericea]